MSKPAAWQGWTTFWQSQSTAKNWRRHWQKGQHATFKGRSGGIKAVEAERDALLEAERAEAQKTSEPEHDHRSDNPPPSAPRMLLDLKGVGPEFALMLWHEGFYRHFDNRRQLASYAGLTPTPWQSGSIDREQGVSKAGNRRLRHAMIELAWLWLHNQPHSTPSLWFKQRVEANGGRRKKSTIVAMARKLLVAQWKYVTFGVAIEGAIMKNA